MKNAKTVLLVAALLQTTLSWSADKVGNGGFTIRCGSKSEILDYFEAEQRGDQIAPIAGNTLEEKVENLLLRLEKVDPNRAKSYRYQYHTYWQSNLKTLDADSLHLSSDQVADPKYQRQFGLGKLAIPQSCELILALQQIAPGSWEDETRGIRIRLFQPAWEKLNLDIQASLILHELFYREYLVTHASTDESIPDEAPQTSAAIRFLNGVLGSERMQRMTTDAWESVLKTVGFIPMFPNFGTELRMFDAEYRFFAYGEIENYLISRSAYFVPEQPELKGWITLDNGQRLSVTSNASKYYLGKYPNELKLNEKSDIDLSSYSNFPIVLDVRANESIFYSWDIHSKSAVLSSINGGYLKTYANPKLRFSGPVQASFSNTASFNEERAPTLSLYRTEFSILEIFDGKNWNTIDNVKFDLSTGQIVK